jgi:glycosyltransferase involved in cell wall biosynthesis
MLDRITPVILTFNEAPNIERTLAQLSWAREIIVVDSCSTDRTRELLSRDTRVRLFERRFTTHAEQWNYAVCETEIRTDWVLALDADYVLSEQIVHEIEGLNPAAHVSGYRAPFTYCIHGKPLRGALYQPVIVLFKRSAGAYIDDGHTQRLRVEGQVLPLTARIYHDDRKPIGHWISAQVRYMRLEAEKIQSRPFMSLGIEDQLRRLVVFAPPAMFFYCLINRGCILDGRHGLLYAFQRATAEAILSLHLIERSIRRKRETNSRTVIQH